MKSYRETAEEVLRRIEAHKIARKRRQKTITLIAVTSLFLCLAVGLTLLLGSRAKNDNPPMSAPGETERADGQVSGIESLPSTEGVPAETNNVTPPIESDKDFSIVYRDGKYYVEFDNVSIYEDVDNCMVANLEFASLKEMKDTVTKGLLSRGEKIVIAMAFPRDENGILFCDFDNLYAPVLPTGVRADGVLWAGDTYSFGFHFDDRAFGYLHYYTESVYYDIFQREYEDFFDRDLITVTETKTLDDGKVATYYSTSSGKFMNIRYSLTKEDKTFIIDKSFCLYHRLGTSFGLPEASATVPSDVTIYCIDDNGYYAVDLFHLTKDPDDSWLLDFGLAPYIEEEV